MIAAIEKTSALSSAYSDSKSFLIGKPYDFDAVYEQAEHGLIAEEAEDQNAEVAPSRNVRQAGSTTSSDSESRLSLYV